MKSDLGAKNIPKILILNLVICLVFRFVNLFDFLVMVAFQGLYGYSHQLFLKA